MAAAGFRAGLRSTTESARNPSGWKINASRKIIARRALPIGKSRKAFHFIDLSDNQSLRLIQNMLKETPRAVRTIKQASTQIGRVRCMSENLRPGVENRFKQWPEQFF